jgi:hypothetical protein
MRLRSWLAVVATILVNASIGRALVAQALPATTVQLPTFSVFSVQTTVSVPDSGDGALGGIQRGFDSSIERGLSPLRARAIASSKAAGGVSVSATIIDHDEIDRALLAAAARRGEAVDPATPKATAISKAVARSDSRAAGSGSADHIASAATSSYLPDSLAAIRERNVAVASERASELASYFAQAKKAEADGKLAMAKVYYQMVARRDTGSLKQQAEERLAALNSKAGTSSKR